MAIKGISQQTGLYTQTAAERRKASKNYPPAIELDAERARKAKNKTAKETPTATENEPTKDVLKLPADYQQGLAKQAQQQYQQERDKVSRIPPVFSKAIQTYQQLELQERREQVSQLMGLDVYA